MRIPFAIAGRDPIARTRSAIVTTCVTMRAMDTLDALDLEIQAAAKKRARAEKAFSEADSELRQLLIRGRAEGKGPSHMAKLTDFTREWVARIAPAAKS